MNVASSREVLKRQLGYMTLWHKRQLLSLGVFSLLVAFSEVGCVGVIALFVAAISNPDALLQSSYYHDFQEFSGGYLPHDSHQLLLLLSGMVVTLAVLKNVSAGSLRYFSTRLNCAISSFFSTSVLSAIMRMPYQWFMTKNLSDLITLTNWGNNAGTMMEYAVLFVADLILLVTLFASIVLLDPTVVFTVLVILGLFSWLIFYMVKGRIDEATKQALYCGRSANRELFKSVYGFKDVRIMGRESEFHKGYSDDMHAMPGYHARLAVMQALPSWILESVGFLVLSLSTCFMLLWAGYSSPKVMALLSVIALAAWRGLPAVIRVINSAAAVRRALPQQLEVLDFMDEATGKVVMGESLWGQDVVPLCLEKGLDFRNVNFSYEGASSNVLSNLSFSVKKGESIGVVGKSGAGKSTLVDLLIGFLKPVCGSVCVDGMPLDDELTVRWMRQVGYVPQAPFVFDGTLAENVAFCSEAEAIDRERVFECCEQAYVTEFLSDLSAGIDSIVGDKGQRLSGGQQQRLCIARALYAHPEVLIFDEATSALDSKSEKFIQDTIHSLQGKLTMFIVAHRLSTVAECNKIIWLEDGVIRMIGAPSEVLPIYEAAH